MYFTPFAFIDLNLDSSGGNSTIILPGSCSTLSRGLPRSAILSLSANSSLFSFLSSTFMAAPPSFPKFRLHFTTFIPVCLAVCDCFHKYGQMRQFCHHLTVSTANRIGHLYPRSAPAPMFLVVPVLGRFFRSLCCLKWTYLVRIAPTASTSLIFVEPVVPINRPLSFPAPLHGLFCHIGRKVYKTIARSIQKPFHIRS